jgi:beta-lactam-binding protein with PASTA domain
MTGIFISYRRQDGQSAAGRLSDELKEKIPEVDIFRDVETIEPGMDFVDAINRALSSCTILLAVIGPRWLTLNDKDGNNRLGDPNDYTRLEVGTALKRQGVRVIPVLVEGATMPSSDDLPEELKPLTRRNAIELTDKRWKYDVGELETTLRQLLGLQPPVSTSVPVPALKLPWKWVTGLVGVLAVSLGLYFTFASSLPTGSVTPPAPMQMPGLIGMPLKDAEQILSKTRLRMATPDVQLTGSAVPRTVLKQSPAAGTLVKPGQEVMLTVAAALTNVDVPNLNGLDLVAAIEALVAKGLKPGATRFDPRERPGDVDKQVHKQSPQARMQVGRNSKVDLWLWGPTVRLPNVIGYEAGKAEQALQAFGLQSQIQYAEIDTVKAGVIIGQRPEGETEQSDNTRVILTVAKAKQPGSTAPVVTLNPKVMEALKTRKLLVRPTMLTH